MNDWPIGLSTGCFFNRSIFDVLETIRDGGFNLLEICSYPPHLDYHDTRKIKDASSRLKDMGLEPFSFHAPFADNIDITDLNPDRRERAVKELLTACDAAAALGVMHLVIHPGPEMHCSPPEQETFQRMKYGAQSLNRVANYCREVGLRLQLENMLPHLLFGKPCDILYMLGAIEETDVGTCLDTGHAYLSGGMSTVVHKLSGHLDMLHVNDNNGDSDSHLPPGHGKIDWHSLIGELYHYQFSGTLILELAGSEDENAEIILGKARAARTYLQDIIKKIQMNNLPKAPGVNESGGFLVNS